MPSSDDHQTAANDADKNPASTETANSGAEPLSPMEGGQWRPVSPDELLRKNPPQPKPKETEPKVNLERRQQLEQHLRASPTDLDGFMELAQIYRAEERPIDAKRILEQAKRIFPDEQKVVWEFEEAVLARSLQQYREVTDLDQRLNTSETHRELKRSRHDWACRRIDVCKARLERDESLVHLRLALAEAKFDAEMYVDAMNAAEQLIDIDEFSPQAYLIKGRCLLEQGKDVEAMVALRAVALRRAVPAPLKLRIIALKLLCETAERLGVQLTLERYRFVLEQVEEQLAAST